MRKQPEITDTLEDLYYRLDPQGKMVVARDRAENAELIRALLNANGDATMLLALDGTVLACNSVLTERFGLAVDAVVGTNLYDLFPPEVSECRRQVAAEVARTGRGTTLRDRRGDRWFDNRIEPVANAEGIIDKLAVFARDVTDAVDAEARIARYITEIERSNEELEQFAYVASHDLREPLRMISSYIGLLERRYGSSLADEAHEFIGFAKEGAQRMDRLILDLLDYSRIARKGAPMAPTSAEAGIALALDVLHLAIAEADAVVSVEGMLPMVVADPHQLARLFQNLIANAVKYRDHARPLAIRVGCDRDCDEGFGRFHVIDNGIGVDPTYAERIFRIFQRLHTREAYDGTGIGLAICKRIVERHGGRIWLEPSPSAGATFMFTLRIA